MNESLITVIIDGHPLAITRTAFVMLLTAAEVGLEGLDDDENLGGFAAADLEEAWGMATAMKQRLKP